MELTVDSEEEEEDSLLYAEESEELEDDPHHRLTLSTSYAGGTGVFGFINPLQRVRGRKSAISGLPPRPTAPPPAKRPSNSGGEAAATAFSFFPSRTSGASASELDDLSDEEGSSSSPSTSTTQKSAGSKNAISAVPTAANAAAAAAAGVTEDVQGALSHTMALQRQVSLRDRISSVDRGSATHRAVLGDIISSAEQKAKLKAEQEAQRRRREDKLLERLEGEEALRRGSEGGDSGAPKHQQHHHQHYGRGSMVEHRPPAVVTFRTTVLRHFGRSGRQLDVDLEARTVTQTSTRGKERKVIHCHKFIHLETPVDGHPCDTACHIRDEKVEKTKVWRFRDEAEAARFQDLVT